MTSTKTSTLADYAVAEIARLGLSTADPANGGGRVVFSRGVDVVPHGDGRVELCVQLTSAPGCGIGYEVVCETASRVDEVLETARRRIRPTPAEREQDAAERRDEVARERADREAIMLNGRANQSEVGQRAYAEHMGAHPGDYQGAIQACIAAYVAAGGK